MKKEISEYHDYRAYLIDFIRNQPGKGHGFKSKIAEALGCRLAYLSQVLNTSANFSPEQAESLNKFFGHTSDESEYFHLLVSYERAGTFDLQQRLKNQIEKFREKRLVLKDRVDIKKTLDIVDQATYYSAWYYAAIHILCTIKGFQNRENISQYLNLPVERVTEVLEFLIGVGLIHKEGGSYKAGVSRIFLGNDSPMISKHHTNWRMRAIDSLDKNLKSDLHFSTVVSIAREDAKRIKEQLVKDIEEARAVIRESKNEDELHCLCIDFFKI